MDGAEVFLCRMLKKFGLQKRQEHGPNPTILLGRSTFLQDKVEADVARIRPIGKMVMVMVVPAMRRGGVKTVVLSQMRSGHWEQHSIFQRRIAVSVEREEPSRRHRHNLSHDRNQCRCQCHGHSRAVWANAEAGTNHGRKIASVSQLVATIGTIVHGRVLDAFQMKHGALVEISPLIVWTLMLMHSSDCLTNAQSQDGPTAATCQKRCRSISNVACWLNARDRALLQVVVSDLDEQPQ